MTIPWRGKNYDQHRLLIVGTSAYTWLEDGQLRSPSENHPSDLVGWQLKGNTNSFMTTVTRGLTGLRESTAEQQATAWDRVAFTNFVSGTVGEGARKDPSPEQWTEARNSFPQLLAGLAPHNVILIGRKIGDHLPETTLLLTYDVKGHRLPDGDTAVCWLVNHTSAGLSWSWLARLVAFIERGTVID